MFVGPIIFFVLKQTFKNPYQWQISLQLWPLLQGNKKGLKAYDVELLCFKLSLSLASLFAIFLSKPMRYQTVYGIFLLENKSYLCNGATNYSDAIFYPILQPYCFHISGYWIILYSKQHSGCNWDYDNNRSSEQVCHSSDICAAYRGKEHNLLQ